MTSISLNVTLPESGSCSVARIRINVDLPAPLGPSSPNMPRGIVRDTSLSAVVPFAYVLESRSIFSTGADLEGVYRESSSCLPTTDTLDSRLTRHDTTLASDLVTEDDSAARQIVWRDFDGHPIAGT